MLPLLAALTSTPPSRVSALHKNRYYTADVFFLVAILLILWFRSKHFEDFDLLPVGQKPLSALALAQAATMNLLVLSLRNFWVLLMHPNCFVLITSRLENVKVSEENAAREIDTGQRRDPSQQAPLKVGIQKISRMASKVAPIQGLRRSMSSMSLTRSASTMNLRRSGFSTSWSSVQVADDNKPKHRRSADGRKRGSAPHALWAEEATRLHNQRQKRASSDGNESSSSSDESGEDDVVHALWTTVEGSETGGDDDSSLASASEVESGGVDPDDDAVYAVWMPSKGGGTTPVGTPLSSPAPRTTPGRSVRRVTPTAHSTAPAPQSATADPAAVGVVSRVVDIPPADNITWKVVQTLYGSPPRNDARTLSCPRLVTNDSA